MKYFSNFPSLTYNLPGMPNSAEATDVTKRFIIRDFYKKQALSFFTYNITDGERPDTVAYNIYGDDSLDWLILLPNEILDPSYEWPMGQQTLNEYIRTKYGSVSTAMAQVHHYEQIIQKRQEILNQDGELILIPEKTLIVDQTTYTSLSPVNRTAVTNYDFELAKNERRRNISIISSRAVPSILEAFRDLY
jgi:hypothetical protein